MSPVTTLMRTLCAAALVAELSGCGDESLTSLVRKGTISGTVTFAKLFAAPPSPAGQHAAPAGFPRAARPLAAKTRGAWAVLPARSEEHTSELQSLRHLVCRLLLEKKKQQQKDCCTCSLSVEQA